MLWVSRAMAAALGQVRIKVRSCAIAAAARGVSMAVRAVATRQRACQSFQENRCKDYAIGTVVCMHMRSIRSAGGRAVGLVAMVQHLYSLSTRETFST